MSLPSTPQNRTTSARPHPSRTDGNAAPLSSASSGVAFLSAKAALSGSSVSVAPRETTKTYTSDSPSRQKTTVTQIGPSCAPHADALDSRPHSNTVTYDDAILGEMESCSNITVLSTHHHTLVKVNNNPEAVPVASRNSPRRSPPSSSVRGGSRSQSPLTHTKPTPLKDIHHYSFPAEQAPKPPPKTTRSQKLRLQQQALKLRSHNVTPPAQVYSTGSQANLLSSASSPAAFYSVAVPSPQPAFPPGKVLRAPAHKTPGARGCGVAAPAASKSNATYKVQYSTPHPANQRPSSAHAQAAQGMRVAARSAPLRAREVNSGSLSKASLSAAGGVTATVDGPRHEGNEQDAGKEKPLSPLKGLLALQQQLGSEPDVAGQLGPKGIGEDLARAIPVVKLDAMADPAQESACLLTPAVPAANIAAPATDASRTLASATVMHEEQRKEAEAVKRLYAKEVQRQQAAATREIEERQAAAAIADATKRGVDGHGAVHATSETAASHFLHHQAQQHPVDYQVCFQNITDPEGEELARMRAAAEADVDDGADDTDAQGNAVAYIQHLGLKVLDRSRNQKSVSTQASALLQDPVMLLACEHLLEDTSKGAVPASPTFTTKLTENAGRHGNTGDAIQSWIAEANVMYENRQAEQQQQQEQQQVLRTQGGGSLMTNIPRSVLKSIPPPGEVFVELSYPAKVLLSAILYVRALGGFPTLLRVGPLTDMSPVVDKENCIELVFWNPKQDEAALAEQQRRQRQRHQQHQQLEQLVADQRQQQEMASVRARAAESAHNVNEIQNRLVRTLSAVMGTPAAGPEGAGLASIPSSRNASFTTTAGNGLFGPRVVSPQHSVLSASPHTATASSNTGHSAFQRLSGVALEDADRVAATTTAAMGGGTPTPTTTASGRVSPSVAGPPQVQLSARPSVTFDGDSALMGCEHDDVASLPVDATVDASVVGAGEDPVATGHTIPRVTVPDAGTRRRLRRSSSLAPLPTTAEAATQPTASHPTLSASQQPSDMARAAQLVGLSAHTLPSPTLTDASNSVNSAGHGGSAAKREPPSTPTKKGKPLIQEGEDELCVVLRAVLAQKSKVYRFGEEETVHVLPPLPREEEDVTKQILRDVALDRLSVRDSDPLYRFLQDEDAKKDAQEKRKALLLERKRRLNARGPVSVNEDGTPSAEDYGDLVVAMLLSGEASQLSGVLPDAMELEALRYRIFSLQGYSTKDPYGMNTRKQQQQQQQVDEDEEAEGRVFSAVPEAVQRLAGKSGGRYTTALSTPAAYSHHHQQQQQMEGLLGRRESLMSLGAVAAGNQSSRGRLASILVSPAQSFTLRQPPPPLAPSAVAATQATTPSAGTPALRREGSFQADLSRTFGIAPQSEGGELGSVYGSPSMKPQDAARARARSAAEAQRRKEQVEKGRLRRHAMAFPLYRASSVSEGTLAAYHAEERAARGRRRFADATALPAHRGASLTRTGRQADASTGGDDRVSLRGEMEKELLRFRPFNYNGFYAELRDAVQYALDVQVRQTKEKVMQAFHM